MSDDDEEVNVNARKRAWARLLAKVSAVDPLVCPQCGLGNEITRFILAQRDEQFTHIDAQAIIAAYHQRGRDMLVNRLFLLFEAFKSDVGTDIIPISWMQRPFVAIISMSPERSCEQADG